MHKMMCMLVMRCFLLFLIRISPADVPPFSLADDDAERDVQPTTRHRPADGAHISSKGKNNVSAICGHIIFPF